MSRLGYTTPDCGIGMKLISPPLVELDTYEKFHFRSGEMPYDREEVGEMLATDLVGSLFASSGDIIVMVANLISC